MKENAPLTKAMRDAEQQKLRVAASIPFHIIAFQGVAYGSKTAEFSIETPIGVVEADLFAPEGRDPFVQARSVRDKFTGRWRRTVALDRTFAARVLEVLRAQAPSVEANHVERKPQRIEPSETLFESERRFDATFGDIDDGGAS